MLLCNVYLERQLYGSTFHKRYICQVEYKAHHQSDCEYYLNKNLMEIIGQKSKDYIGDTFSYSSIAICNYDAKIIYIDYVYSFRSAIILFLSWQTIQSIEI